MIINLKTLAAKNEQQALKIELKDRLPSHFCSPCIINCLFAVKQFTNYYLVSLKSDSMLILTCQRCLGEFSYHYTNLTEVAVCDSDETAEKMMNQYDCLVSTNQVDLQEIVTDELHLYAPEFHFDLNECDHGVDKFISIELK